MSPSRGSIARVLVLMCLAGCACETAEERARAHLATARAAITSGAHDEAVQALEQAVQLDETLPEAWSLLARERAELGRHEGAVEAAQRAVELAPGDHDTWSLLAREQLALGAHEEAATSAEHALERVPPHADDAEVLARARVGLSEWAPAREAFARALELDPARHPLLLELGRVEDHLGRAGDALATYRRALEADAESVEARIRIAALLIRAARGERLVGGDRDAAEEARAMDEAAILGLASLGVGPYRDVHAERRAEARTLLTEARERLEDEADPRRASIDAYLRGIDELDAESERRRAEAQAREREMRSRVGSLLNELRGEPFGGLLGGAFGSDALMGGGEPAERGRPGAAVGIGGLRGPGIGSLGGEEGYGAISTSGRRRASSPPEEPAPTF